MAVTQYIGARYVPLFADPAEWSADRTYEPLTIVLHQGNSYTSRQFVPRGIQITDARFWAETGDYNAQVEQYRQEVLSMDGRMDAVEASAQANATAISNEVTRATAAEQANATAITDEATRATTAEQANTTAISNEVTRATAAEQANATAITDEATRATTAEQANATAISNEVTRATAAEQANAARIARIESDERFIPVEHYGITTSNTAADNNVAFQAALNECAADHNTLVFGIGTYEFTGNIEIPDHGKITGVSMTDTIIHCTGDNFIHTKTESDGSFVTVDGEISNMTIYGDVTPSNTNPYLELVNTNSHDNEFCLYLGFYASKLENLFIRNVKGAIRERTVYVAPKDYPYYCHTYGNLYDFRNIQIYNCGCGIKSTVSDTRWTHINMGVCYAGAFFAYGEIHDVHVWGFYYPLHLERVVATNLEIESNGLLDASVADFRNGSFLQIWNTTISGCYFWNLYGTNDVSSSTDSPGILVRSDYDSSMNSGCSITGMLVGPYTHDHANGALYPSPSRGLIAAGGTYAAHPERTQPCYVQGVIARNYSTGKLGSGPFVFNVIANNTTATITNAVNASDSTKTVQLSS